MTLSLFTFADIQTKVRNLTGHKDASDLSESDLKKYINRYYQLILPLEIRPNELVTWFEFNTTASDGEYDLDTDLDFYDNYITLNDPAFVDGYDLDLYMNPELFFDKWPEITTYDESRPEDVLFYDRKLIFRYVPDDTYTIKIAAWKRPSALVDSTDYPKVEEWGPLISYGASKEIAEDYGDLETLQIITPFYQQHKAYVMNKVHFQNQSYRAYPTF